jgi:hypothetical protein
MDCAIIRLRRTAMTKAVIVRLDRTIQFRIFSGSTTANSHEQISV